MMGKTKKNSREKNKYISDFRIPDYLIWIYLISLAIYTLVMHDKYFDITATKASFFSYVTVTFVVLMMCAYVIEYYVSASYKVKSIVYKEEFGRRERYKSPLFWMVGFALSNVFAFIVTDYKNLAFDGESGCRMGLLMYLIIAAMFVCIYFRAKINLYAFVFMLIATIVSYYIAFAQHFGYDIFKLREKIAPKSMRIYISTFGNINIYSSYLCLCIPVFFVIAIFANNLLYRLVAMLMIVASGGMLMIANSDGAYIGMFALASVLFFIALKEKKLVEEFLCGSLIALGNLVVAILQKMIDTKYDKRGGVAAALSNIKVAVALLVVLIFVTVISFILRKKYKEHIDKINVKKVQKISFIALMLGVLIVCITGIICKWSFFTFNYDWGTKRGYIWAKSIDLFKNAPVSNKIFGYGNDIVKNLTTENYYNEMIRVTGKVYANSHNELLQYLVTLGIVGFVTYLGLFVSSVVYMWKNASKNPAIYACMLAVITYFAQSLINLNQPITTPLYFVLMAIGLGACRYEKKIGEIND